jgi:rod shape determining protein RodA
MQRGNLLPAHIDWLLLLALVPILGVGLVTMNSFVGVNTFFEKQIIWLVIAVAIFFIASFVDWRFLRRTDILVFLFIATVLLLVAVKFLGVKVNGSESWFRIGGIFFQPSDIAKVVLIIILAKYFSRRHIEIANFRHIIVSGFYALVLFTLVFLHPDLGSAVILFFIWLGMVLVSGISKKHLAVVFLMGIMVFTALWTFVFAEYQKQRIITFLHPLTDVRNSGYNAFQSVIAIGSGGLFGKGVGYGTQSRLNFLPEYQTDFIFAAFAEEWGFAGAAIILLLYLFVVWRIIRIALVGATNFEVLFGLGVAVYFICHIMINVGMNLSLLPVTGITLPFMSYGGSHLVAEFLSLGILMGMRRYARPMHKDAGRNEIVGVTDDK